MAPGRVIAMDSAMAVRRFSGFRFIINPRYLFFFIL